MKKHNVAKAAVIVIDVQTGVFETTPEPLDKEKVFEHINRITASARENGSPVIFLQHESDLAEQWLTPFTEEWRLHPRLQVEPDNHIVRKTACDGFYRTELEEYLRDRDIETLVITGYATDFCVDTTLRSAASKEFGIIVATEAHTTKDRPILPAPQIKAHHEWMWENLICPKGISLFSTAEVVQSFST